MPDRDHVFYLQIPKEWKTPDLGQAKLGFLAINKLISFRLFLCFLSYLTNEQTIVPTLFVLANEDCLLFRQIRRTKLLFVKSDEENCFFVKSDEQNCFSSNQTKKYPSFT